MSKLLKIEISKDSRLISEQIKMQGVDITKANPSELLKWDMAAKAITHLYKNEYISYKQYFEAKCRLINEVQDRNK